MVLTIGLVYNIKKTVNCGNPDISAEYDDENTVSAIRGSLEGGGHSVAMIEADLDVYSKLRSSGVDIVFNIAEGLRGESRESHVPVLCEMLGIPYTGSGPLTLAICLNKARTKEILNQYNIPTAKHQVFRTPEDRLDQNLKYPLIVKLLHEGSSMGLDNEKSIIENEGDLRAWVKYLIDTYKEPVIVEEFLSGREFTIPVLGYKDPLLLPIIEIIFKKGYRINLFVPDDPVVPLINNAGRRGEVKEPPAESVCPAKIPSGLENRIRTTTLATFKALDMRDWCRMEMRLDSQGVPNVLEVNPIAGIDPTYWLPKSARAADISYDKLINIILDSALDRYCFSEEKRWASL